MATVVRRSSKKPTYGSGLVPSIVAPLQGVPPSQPPPVSGPPLDPQWIAQQAAANRGLALGDAFDTYNLGRLESQSGFNNASDPYSVAMRMQDKYNASQRGTTNSYASQGQLYSGAIQNARDLDAKNYATSYHDAYNQYQGQKDAITQGRINRYSTTTGDVSQDQINAILRALGQ